MYCEDGGEDGLGFFVGERGASEESLQESTVGIVVGYILLVRHFEGVLG